MKTLRVTLADIIGPTGTPNSTATVHARYVDTSGRGRDVHLTDGTIVVPVRRVASPDGDPEVFDFDVYANDAAPVREVDYGHLVEVSWTVVAPTGAKSSGVKRVQITDSMASVVQLGLLATPTPVPPYTGGYSLPGHKHVVGDITATGTPSASTYLRGDGSWSTPAGGGGGGVTDHGALTGLDGDDHPQYALADGTRGTFAAPLGADDNYVTDAEKAALHAHGNKAALDLVSGTNTGDQTLPTWSTIAGKPAVVAAGATQADARTAIGAGTSSLVVGTSAGDAKAGNYQPTAANISDSTATGRALLTAADAAAARTALELGTLVSADADNAAILGTDDLIYVPKAIGRSPGVPVGWPNVNINGRAVGNVNATTLERVISHYNPEAFTCDEIGLIHRSGNVSATYRLAIWSGYPNPSLVFATPEFSVPTTGEATVVFTVPGWTVFPRGVWYIGFVLTSGTSGTFNSGVRNTSFEPNRDPNNAGALNPSNFGVVSLGWTPPAMLTLDLAWAAGATPQLLAKNLRFV